MNESTLHIRPRKETKKFQNDRNVMKRMNDFFWKFMVGKKCRKNCPHKNHFLIA